MMRKTEGFIEKRDNLPIFQAQVGEGVQRSFHYDAHLQTLYTDVNSVNEQGGYDTTEEVAITAHDKDEFSVRCWQMTAAHRAKYDADVANSNGKPADEMPTEGPGIPMEEEVSESSPVISEEERQQVADVREIPAHLTPSEPTEFQPLQQPNPPGVITEDDLMASVIITNQRTAIDNLKSIIELYIEDDKAKQFADNIYDSLGRLYNDYGLGNSDRGTQDSDPREHRDAGEEDRGDA